MKLFTETLKNNGAKLICYVQEPCAEMPQVQQRPAVLILPGGGYTNCCPREGEPIALAYLHEGYQAFVLEYTTGVRTDKASMAAVFPKAYTDVCEAMVYLHSHAEELHLIPDRIAVVGFSAGGNLAAALGIAAPAEEKPNAMILGYPAITPEVNAGLGVEQPNLLAQVDENTPPAFLFNTQGDRVIPAKDTLLLAMALADAGVPFECHTFLTGDHGLSLATSFTTDDGSANPDVAQWFAMSTRFLKNLWDKPVPNDAPHFSANSKIDALLNDTRARAVLDKVLPGIADRLAANPMSRSMTMAMMVKVSGGVIPDEKLKELDAQLNLLH